MIKLFKVCLDIEGNDKGLTVTTVAAENSDEAIEKAKGHVGKSNQNQKNQNVTVKGCKEVGTNGCLADAHIPREWM